MGDLIVDFPSRGRDRGADAAAKRASVRFAPRVDVFLLEQRRDAPLGETWHSSEDIEAMKAENYRRAARELPESFRASRGSEDAATSEELKCLKDGVLTGLERALSPEILRKTIASRRGCCNAVLEEQGWQEMLGECDPVRIRRASLRHTKWARRRAHVVGLLNARP